MSWENLWFPADFPLSQPIEDNISPTAQGDFAARKHLVVKVDLHLARQSSSRTNLGQFRGLRQFIANSSIGKLLDRHYTCNYVYIHMYIYIYIHVYIYIYTHRNYISIYGFPNKRTRLLDYLLKSFPRPARPFK